MTTTDTLDLQISEILDKSTFVITGRGVEKLKEGEDLLVVAVGGIVKNTSAPLVMSKAKLEVTSAVGPYAVARPPMQEVHENNLWSSIATSARTVHRRLPLQVDEEALVGNPGLAPIKVGDPVIRPRDLQSFVATRRNENKT